MCLRVSTTSVTDARSMPAPGRFTSCPARGKFKSGSNPLVLAPGDKRPDDTASRAKRTILADRLRFAYKAPTETE